MRFFATANIVFSLFVFFFTNYNEPLADKKSGVVACFEAGFLQPVAA